MGFNFFNLNNFYSSASTGRGFFSYFNSFTPFRFGQYFNPFSYTKSYSFGSFSRNFGGYTPFTQRAFSFLSAKTRPWAYRPAASTLKSVASTVESAVSNTGRFAAVSADQKKRLKQYGPAFLAKVKQVAQKINCEYQDLLAVMNAESGINHIKPNQAGHHYYGLIQFGEDAARSVGTTTQKLVRMSALEQLDYVEKYFLVQRKNYGWGNKKLSAAELYGLVFAPARAKGNVFYTKAANRKAYNANRPIDATFGNNDGVITKNELQNYMNTKRIDENLFLA